MRRTLIIGLAISASLALAACGSSASPAAAPPSPAASAAGASTAASPAASAAVSQAAAAGASAITIQNFAFAPASLTVKAGTTVTWTNNDSPTHSVKWADGAAGSSPLTTGSSYTRKFATPGTYAYVCGIHASMHGTIVVN
jgi:plastocyanin